MTFCKQKPLCVWAEERSINVKLAIYVGSSGMHRFTSEPQNAHPMTAHLWIEKFPLSTWMKTNEMPDGMTGHSEWWQGKYSDLFLRSIDHCWLLPGQRTLKMVLSARGLEWSRIESLRIEREVIYAAFQVSILWEKCRQQQHERFLREKRHKDKLGDH